MYSHIRNLPFDKLETIWRARWSSGKILYLFCRYSVIFYLGGICFVYQFLLDCSLETAKALSNLQFWGAIVVYVPFQILVGVRTYALYNQSKYIKWAIMGLFAVYLLVVIAVGVLFTEEGVYGQIPLRGVYCSLRLQKFSRASVITIVLAGAVYDLILWIMLVVRVYRAFIEGQKRLIGVIFRLGLLYFTFVTIMYIVCAVLFFTVSQTDLPIPIAVSHCLQAMGSVLSARFILHLRSYLTDMSIQSMSVSPERIMRVENEIKFGASGSSGSSGMTIVDVVSYNGS